MRRPKQFRPPHQAARAILEAAAAGDWTVMDQRLAESQALTPGAGYASTLEAERAELLAAVAADLRQAWREPTSDPARLSEIRASLALLGHLATSPGANQPGLRPM